MFERFTETARAVVTGARDEAQTLGHRCIGTEHVLLALLHPASGAPAAILRDAAVDRGRVLVQIEQWYRPAGGVLTAADAEALRTIGIDLDTVLAAIERSFGPGALRPAPLPAGRLRPRRPGGLGRLGLRRLGLRTLNLRRLNLRRRRQQLHRAGVPGPHIPFTPRSKKVLELSLREALRLGHNHIASEHILLGLLREGDGLAARILVDAGLALDDLRRRTLRVIDDAA